VQRLVTATIELLAERRFSEVSTREIAARAGLYKQLITRHFGTIDGLFIEVVHELLSRGLAGFDGTQASLEQSQVALEMRSRLIAWLVTSGVEPLSIVPREDQEMIRDLLRSRVPALADDVPERAARALSSIVSLLNQANAVFVPTIHNVTPQDVLDVQLLVAYLLQQLNDASRLYGWDAEG
jgi:AcrR family transcriptional regulator